jgi:DNA primase
LEAAYLKQPSGFVAVVVEGVVDALMVWQATRDFRDSMGFPVLPLALLGSSPSQEQANLLVRLTADRRIVSFLDNDQAGRKGDRELYELVGCRVRFHRVRYGDNQAGADPGGMEAEAIREAIQGAQVILKDTQE